MDDKTINFLISIKDNIKQLEIKKGKYSPEIVRLKDRFYDLIEKEKKSASETISQTKKKLHKPKETKLLLNKFKSSENIKFLTHDYIGEFDYLIFTKAVKRDLNNILKNNWNIPEQLIARIKAFLEQEKWFRIKNEKKYNYRLSWASKEVQEWCIENKGKHPFKNIRYRDEFIVPFKHSIEIRKGDLPKIFHFIQEKFSELNIEISEALTNAQFYTDVDILEEALIYIFRDIKEIAKPEGNIDITVNFETETIRDDKTARSHRIKIIEIIHNNSKANKNPNDDDFIGGGFNTIKDNLLSLCNWSVKSEYDNKFYIKRILDDNQKSLTEEISKEEVKGFTHILYFY